MHQTKSTQPRLSLTLLAAALIAILPTATWAFNSGSTGADGALSPTVSTEIQLSESGVLNYTTINIPTGVTVTFKKNTTNTPIQILASGDVTIAGWIDIAGKDGKDIGTYGDGALGDDGIAGVGGTGGFDGGRGGRDDVSLRPEIIRGGAGLGPGGGKGGIEGSDGCADGRYLKYVGIGGAYASNAYSMGSGPNYWNCNPDASQSVSKAYGSPLLQPLIGGSGGGGGRGGANYPGSGGGGGGGAILIASSGAIRLTGGTSGGINARGGDAGGVAGTNAGYNGAGGSGGAIRLVATTITGNGYLLAEGGCIHLNNGVRQYCGSDGYANRYGGANGRIRLEAESVTYSGTSQPAYVADVPGPVFIAGAPSLRIASVAGQVAPVNPTGKADVSLPATTTAPVEIVFATTNVPPGNTVLLRVIPAYGNPIEVLSPAITGSTASGTATVSVTLPQGPSTLQATTTYTVVLAMGESLSRFAQNERVEKVSITVAMAQEPKAKLITISGKEYEVPYSVLKEAGFKS